MRRCDPCNLGTQERADAIEREHERFARQCDNNLAQQIDAVRVHFADERERQMDVGIDYGPAASTQGNVASQHAEQRLRRSVGDQRKKDPQRPRLRRSFHPTIVASAHGKNNAASPIRDGAALPTGEGYALGHVQLRLRVVKELFVLG